MTAPEWVRTVKPVGSSSTRDRQFSPLLDANVWCRSRMGGDGVRRVPLAAGPVRS